MLWVGLFPLESLFYFWICMSVSFQGLGFFHYFINKVFYNFFLFSFHSEYSWSECLFLFGFLKVLQVFFRLWVLFLSLSLLFLVSYFKRLAFMFRNSSFFLIWYVVETLNYFYFTEWMPLLQNLCFVLLCNVYLFIGFLLRLWIIFLFNWIVSLPSVIFCWISWESLFLIHFKYFEDFLYFEWVLDNFCVHF